MKKFLTSYLLFILLGGLIFGQSNTQSEKIFLIKTSLGNIKIKLYNDTPLHSGNFSKLVKDGYYNGTIFNSVINQFKIQGGAAKDGAKDVANTVPAEINAKYFNKRGALAAANTNQLNATTGTYGWQFYIVQGRKFTDNELDAIEKRINRKFTTEERDAYKTVGGAPFLDCTYTIFGEVTEGLDVVDKIAAVKTGTANKPLEDITITIEEVK